MEVLTFKAKFDGLYEWGGGWTSSTASAKWDYFWRNIFGTKDCESVFWGFYERNKGFDKSQHLVCTGGSIYLHPMGFDFVIHKLGGCYSVGKDGKKVEVFSDIEELKDICEKCAEYCGGSVRFGKPIVGEVEVASVEES